MGMIQIDMPMPESCIDCPFKEQEHGEGECLADKEKRCTYGDSSGRQEWCPLKEHEEVVRCKDCKYYTEKAFKNNGVNYGECHKLAIGLGVFTADDWFCADGEQRG